MRKPVVLGTVAMAALAGFAIEACGSSSSDQGSPKTDGGNSSGAAATGGGTGAGSSGAGTGAQSGGASSGSTGSGAQSGTSSGAGSGASSGTSSGASSSGGSSEGGPPSCKADCTGKVCGPNGCGGTCGGCAPSALCGPAQTCLAPVGGKAIVVDAKSQLTPISPGIYGVALNNDDSMQLASLNRWGGDATSSYNWQIDVSNAGTDWNCANYKGRFDSPTPDSSLKTSSDQFVRYNVSKLADTLMTIPITGWVASMATPNPGMPDCAGSSKISSCCTTLGTSEEMLVDKGSGTLDTSFMGMWIAHLVSTFGSASSGGVKYYQLDNEPDNWQSLRTDVYSTLYPPGGTCEAFYSTNSSIGKSLNQDFIDRTMAYAKAIKAADPGAQVLFMSTENSEDLVALPNVECGNPTGPYSPDNSLTMAILKQAAAEEAMTGSRPLDCVDMHYPFPGKGLGDTNALWETGATAVPPRIQGWINSTFPGTGICVSEYNVPSDGGDGNTPGTSTGAQEADILGMYGRLGYLVAAYWTSLSHGTTHLPIYNAMAMYRNYDGKGGRFGSTSIGAASPNVGVNVYASSDSPTNPTKVWVMLVNVSGTDQNGLSLKLQNFNATGSAQVYRTNAGAAPTQDTAIPVTGGGVSGISLPTDSVALLVLTL